MLCLWVFIFWKLFWCYSVIFWMLSIVSKLSSLITITISHKVSIASESFDTIIKKVYAEDLFSYFFCLVGGHEVRSGFLFLKCLSIFFFRLRLGREFASFVQLFLSARFIVLSYAAWASIMAYLFHFPLFKVKFFLLLY